MIRSGWWSLILLVLALPSYWGGVWLVVEWRLHVFAQQTPPALAQALLPIVPCALPIICAAASVWFAIRALTVLGAGVTDQNGDEDQWIRRLGWLQFEQLVESHFAHRGVRTVLLQGLPQFPPRLSVIDASGATTLVHYAEWKTVDVGYEIVQAFVDEIAARSAQSGQLLTFGRLTRGAASLAATHKLEIVSGDKLIRMLRASGWDSSRFRESGTSTGFGNSGSADSGSRH